MGIHGQNLFVDRVNRLIIAILPSQGVPVDLPAWMLTHAALPELRRCLIKAGLSELPAKCSNAVRCSAVASLIGLLQS
jgi:hypothetical protein